MSNLTMLNKQLEKAKSDKDESLVFEIEQIIDNLTSSQYGDL